MKLNYQSHSNKPGIYKIINTHTNRIYIGQAKEFKNRWKGHISSFNKNKAGNKFLQNDFNKCKLELGHDNFLEFHVVEVMEGSTKPERSKREGEYIAQYFDKQKQCYNFREKAEEVERACYSLTPEETHKKKSESMKKVWQDPEFRAAVASSMEEYWSTPEAKETASKNSKKKWEDPIFRETIVQSMRERAANFTEEDRKQYVERMNASRTPETYQKKMDDYQKQLHENVVINEIKDWIGPSSQTTSIYKNAFLLSPDGILYKNIQNLRQFAFENKLNEEMIRRVCLGQMHTCEGWKRHVPEGMESSVEVVASKEKKVYGDLVDPSGNVYYNVTGLHSFGEKHGIFKSQLQGLFSRKLKSAKGWRLLENVNKLKFGMHNVNLISPTGEIFMGPIRIRDFKSYGLVQSNLQLLITGKINQYKGWKLYNS